MVSGQSMKKLDGVFFIHQLKRKAQREKYCDQDPLVCVLVNIITLTQNEQQSSLPPSPFQALYT